MMPPLTMHLPTLSETPIDTINHRDLLMSMALATNNTKLPILNAQTSDL